MNFMNKVKSIKTKQVVAGQRKRPRAGTALLRLREYVELGVKKAKTEGHKNPRSALLVFELHHPDHIISGTKEDGTKYSFPDTIRVYVNIAGPTSRFGKLFNKLNHDGAAVHMAQLVGKAFMGQIFHNGEYNNLSNDAGEWVIGAPEYLDPMTNVLTAVPVPEMDGKPRVFIYEHPDMEDSDIQEMWDGIYIDGENSEGKSRNWIQNAIRESLDWETSRTKAIVTGEAAVGDAIVADMDAASAPDPLAQLGIK